MASKQDDAEDTPRVVVKRYRKRKHTLKHSTPQTRPHANALASTAPAQQPSTSTYKSKLPDLSHATPACTIQGRAAAFLNYVRAAKPRQHQDQLRKAFVSASSLKPAPAPVADNTAHSLRPDETGTESSEKAGNPATHIACTR